MNTYASIVTGGIIVLIATIATQLGLFLLTTRPRRSEKPAYPKKLDITKIDIDAHTAEIPVTRDKGPQMILNDFEKKLDIAFTEFVEDELNKAYDEALLKEIWDIDPHAQAAEDFWWQLFRDNWQEEA